MADIIVTIPAKVIATDTNEHEIQFDASLFTSGPIVLAIEVTVGTITFSRGKAKTGGSAAYAAASNNKLYLTLRKGNESIFYTATTISDAFTISE
jgi:hypothetical protein